ncbi:MAG: ATP-binding protein, partial [Pseudomonadales bacterium]
QAFKKYERLGGGGGKAGLGLGLFLVRQIVTAHGGRVGFEPDRPSGVGLTMWLPEGNA